MFDLLILIPMFFIVALTGFVAGVIAARPPLRTTPPKARYMREEYRRD